MDFNRICFTVFGESLYIISFLVKKKYFLLEKYLKIKYLFFFIIKEKECYRDNGSMILVMILVKSYFF